MHYNVFKSKHRVVSVWGFRFNFQILFICVLQIWQILFFIGFSLQGYFHSPDLKETLFICIRQEFVAQWISRKVILKFLCAQKLIPLEFWLSAFFLYRNVLIQHIFQSRESLHMLRSLSWLIGKFNKTRWNRNITTFCETTFVHHADHF